MIINWKEFEDKDHVIAWLIVEAIAGSKRFKKMESYFDPTKMDVRMTINGVEVPIIGPLLALQGQLERIEKEGKIKGLEEAWDTITDVWEEKKEDMLENVRERMLE